MNKPRKPIPYRPASGMRFGDYMLSDNGIIYTTIIACITITVLVWL